MNDRLYILDAYPADPSSKWALVLTGVPRDCGGRERAMVTRPCGPAEERVMDRVRRIAGLPCGRKSKWFVLAFWIAVFAVASPLSSKLNSAQENDASAWLPTNAESTQVDELAKQFTPSDVIPTLVVYERPGGPVTAADRAKAAADVQRLAGVRDVSGKILGPIPSKDGHALQLV